MKPSNLKWWISLAVLASVVLTGTWASAQNGQGLAAVGAPDPTNGFPRWYMDRNGLQLGQCLDTTNPADPCVLGIVPGSPAPNVLPNPAAPLAFTANFPGEFFFWRTTAVIPGIGGNAANRAHIVLSTQGGFMGPTLTPADGAAAIGVFARWRLRVLPGGLVPGATYTLTGPFGSTSIVASATGTINFTRDQGCIPTPGAVPPPCNFAAALATTNTGPFLTWDPAVAPLPVAGFIGQGLIAHSIINSPLNQNFFRVTGPNVGGPGVDVVETNQFVNVIGKIYVRPATSTTLTSTPNPSVVGQAVTLTATVRPVVADTIAPTGTVTFKDGATALGVATMVNGTASFVTSALAAGTHSLTAVYVGDLEFATSTSAVVTQTVQNVTSTILTSTPNPSTVGQAVTLTANVTSAGGVPTGTVTFKDGALSLSTVALSATGTASFTTSALAAGTHSLTAAYSGAPLFTASTSPVVTQTVVANSTSTSLTSTPNPSTAGQAVTLTATVTSAGGVPTGTVTFRDGATSLGVVTLVNGSATLSISTLAAGSHPLTAVYSGSATFAASTSAVVTQIVNNPAAARDTVAIARNELRVATGELRVEGTNTQIPGGGFAASVTIHDGAAVGGSCPGAVIGTTSAAGGNWAFRQVTPFRPTTICVQSAGGGVASGAVTQK